MEMPTDCFMAAASRMASTLSNELTFLWLASWANGLMRWFQYSQAIWFSKSGLKSWCGQFQFNKYDCIWIFTVVMLIHIIVRNKTIQYDEK